MKRSLVVIAAILIPVFRGHPQNTQPDIDGPGPRVGHSLVYHDDLRAVVLIDGYPSNAPAETVLWKWDGKRWGRLPGGGAPSRSVSAAAHDSIRKRLVVFAGRIGDKEITGSDTWEWDGRTWRERTGSTPGLRDHHTLAFDAHRGRVVLYGGTVPLEKTHPQAQRRWDWPGTTWEWDGDRWHQIKVSGPGSRNVSSLAYDPIRRNVVLFGGYGEDRINQPDTWTYDGKQWKQAATAGPSARSGMRMAFDSDRGVMLLYGGSDRTNQLGDLWQWDGSKWSEIKFDGPSPGPRSVHAMAYDRARKRLVLHGGNSARTIMSDTWEWDGKSWRKGE